MPDHPQGGGKPAPKDHVAKHLKKNGVSADELPAGVITALNDCSDAELSAMDSVGTSMEKAKLEPNLRISAVH
jgi:hypothetical protein